MRTSIVNLTVMVAVMALSGCEAMNAAIFPKNSASEPKPVDHPEPTSAVQTASIDPDLRPGVKPQLSSRRVDPRTLIGKNQGDVRDMLGAPADIKNAAPATIWRYSAQNCALEVFFYMDLGTNTLRALTYDAKVAEVAANDDVAAQCVGTIQSINRITSR